MKNKPLILIGGGGHCVACIDVIEQENKYLIEGILDTEAMIGKQILGYPVLGTDGMITDLVKEGFYFLITVGQIKSAAIRKRIFENLKAHEANMAIVISPRSYISAHSLIGEGSVVMHGAIINAGVTIRVNAIINSNSLIEHETVIGNHCHISTAAVVNGNVKVGDEVFVGSGSVLSNNIEIAPRTVIGAGAVVTKSIKEAGIYAGNPYRLIVQEQH